MVFFNPQVAFKALVAPSSDLKWKLVNCPIFITCDAPQAAGNNFWQIPMNCAQSHTWLVYSQYDSISKSCAAIITQLHYYSYHAFNTRLWTLRKKVSWTPTQLLAKNVSWTPTPLPNFKKEFKTPTPRTPTPMKQNYLVCSTFSKQNYAKQTLYEFYTVQSRYSGQVGPAEFVHYIECPL